MISSKGSIALLFCLLLSTTLAGEYLPQADFNGLTCASGTTAAGTCSLSTSSTWVATDSVGAPAGNFILTVEDNVDDTATGADILAYLSTENVTSAKVNQCIKQQIPFMPSGSYTFSVGVWDGYNVGAGAAGSATISDYVILFKVIDSTNAVIAAQITTTLTGTVGTLHSLTGIAFTIPSDSLQLSIHICGSVAGGSARGISIKNPSIKRVADQAVGTPCTTGNSAQPSTTGSNVCVSHTVYQKSYNCNQFNTAGTICANCLSGSLRPAYVKIPYSGTDYWGCAQVLIPGAATYKLTSPQLYDTAVTSTAKPYLTSLACTVVSGIPTGGNGILKVSAYDIANSAAVDTTGVACTPLQPGVTTYIISAGAYVVQTCDTGNGYAKQTLTSPAVITCMRNIYFDASTTSCSTYAKNSANIYVCSSCFSGFSLIQVADSQPGNTGLPALGLPDTIISGTNPKICVDSVNVFIPDCSLYIIYVGASASTYNFYCKTGSCALPSQEVTILKDSAVNIGSISSVSGCTRQLRYGTDPTTSVVHPYSSACTVYARTTATTVFPFCDPSGTGSCTQGSPAECRLTALPATTCGANLIDVSYNGVSQCAAYGAIPGCANYSSWSDPTISKCYQCIPGWTLVNDTNNVLICVRYLIDNCKKYVHNGLCAECYSGVFSIAYKVCNRAANPGPTNCNISEYFNERVVCRICNLGYVLQVTDRSSGCVAIDIYCAFYNSTGFCNSCVPNYELISGNCILKNANLCKSVDPATGLCAVCVDNFNLVNGACLAQGVCTTGQYKNSNGVCVSGNVANCQQYKSPSGLCANCNKGFRINTNSQCQQTDVVCDDNTSTYKFVVNNLKCVKTDVNCRLANDDGSCPVCEDGWYSANGICIPSTIDSSNGNLRGSNNEDNGGAIRIY